ncbi:MAG: 50S ribosome-binding GTPase [Mariniblastus sp.]|nr:50S ribosome-binding GTPase [Mariniblastus sp.]
MSRLSIDDTIAAIASPPGPGIRGIVRLSGPATERSVSRLVQTEPPLSSILSARSLAGTIRIDSWGEIPCQLLYWPDSRSYTRQPSAEIHMTGSRPLLEWILERICREEAVRLATPGEFTLRAFLSGRIDLTQAEAVLGVIEAAGSHDLETALSQLAGGLATPLSDARKELLYLLAELEAGLDFAEEDIEFLSRQELSTRLASCHQALERTSQQVAGRKVNQSDLKAVLVGWPNAGKSSLFNQLVDGQAIVSGEAGTTRDYLTGKMWADSIPIELVDTAGLEFHEQPTPIESAAQAATRQQLEQADLRILCLDGSRPINQWEREQLERSSFYHIRLQTKADQPVSPIDAEQIDLRTSTVTGIGIDQLKSTMGQVACQLQNSESSVVHATAVRVENSLWLATESIQRARETVRAGLGDELVAAEMRRALDQLGQVVGTIYTDDLLDVVFGKFCIGK